VQVAQREGGEQEQRQAEQRAGHVGAEPDQHNLEADSQPGDRRCDDGWIGQVGTERAAQDADGDAGQRSDEHGDHGADGNGGPPAPR